MAGKPLTTTLNIGLQKLAEKTLANQASQCSGRHPSLDGAIVAAANGPGNRGQSLATVGRAARIHLQGRLRVGPAAG